jgi:hypothetical protein
MPQQIEVVPYSEIRKELRGLCNKSDTDKIAAKKLKVTQSTLSLTLRGKANVVPEKILKALKLKTELVYVRTGKAKAPAVATTSTVLSPAEVLTLENAETGVVSADAIVNTDAGPIKAKDVKVGHNIKALADRTVREITSDTTVIDVGGKGGDHIEIGK